MKKIILFFSFLISSASFCMHDFSITLEPIWKDLESNQAATQQFGGKWILIGSITFKKKSGETVFLHNLRLQWKGSAITTLFGTLYKKVDGKTFLPLEENMICDGTWYPHDQSLVLNFNKKITLGISNTFYLVLTVPEDVEQQLKKGYFALDEKMLPEPFIQYMHGQQIALAYHEQLYS